VKYCPHRWIESQTGTERRGEVCYQSILQGGSSANMLDMQYQNNVYCISFKHHVVGCSMIQPIFFFSMAHLWKPPVNVTSSPFCPLDSRSPYKLWSWKILDIKNKTTSFGERTWKARTWQVEVLITLFLSSLKMQPFWILGTWWIISKKKAFPDQDQAHYKVYNFIIRKDILQKTTIITM
jgi:hypothetical protein